jgi:uncharacterized zinc-type alcohol dehydrogenase-like protein
MGVKFAHAFGAQTFVVTSSPGKKDAALKLGADGIIVSSSAEDMAAHAGSFDFLLNTVAAPHDVNRYLNLLRLDGTMVMVGVPEKPLEIPAFTLIGRRRSIGGSLIGGIPETQEMLDFCGKHNITADIEMIPIQQINAAYERMIKSDVRYRFVIDISTLN